MKNAPRSTNVPRLGLNLAEVALALGVSPNTVLRMVDDGHLPRPRVWHRRKIWRTAEIDAAMSEWPIEGLDEQGIPSTEAWRMG